MGDPKNSVSGIAGSSAGLIKGLAPLNPVNIELYSKLVRKKPNRDFFLTNDTFCLIKVSSYKIYT